MAYQGSHFDASRAELFEALGHPVRVKILHALDQRPMGFAELKKATGIESSGHLQFHMGKLSGLIGTTGEGDYTLTDDGKEAIRVLGLPPRGTVVGGMSGKQNPFGKGNRLKPLVAVLLVALVALAGVVVYQQTAGITRSTTTVTVPLGCGGQIVWSQSSNQSLTPVLLMQPNTTGYACVTYQSYWQGNPDYNFTGSFGAPSGTFQFSPFTIDNEQCTAGYGCFPRVYNNFRVSAVPASVGLNAYTNYVSVLYSVTALANSTGYYSNSVPYGACSSMPMAVGHAAADVNRSDFGPLIEPSCGIFLPLYPVMVTVSGMGVTFIS